MSLPPFTVPTHDLTPAASFMAVFIQSGMISLFPTRLVGGEGEGECVRKAEEGRGYGLCDPKSIWKTYVCMVLGKGRKEVSMDTVLKDQIGANWLY